MNRAVFLDRDGVITREPPYYAHKVSQLRLISRAAEAIRLLNENGFLVIIASNQAGIARGYYHEEDMISFNQAMKEKLIEDGAYIDAIYYCPHHPDEGIGEFRVDCDCRKPKPGMLTRARKELDINLKKSFMVGDKSSDIEAGKKAGCKTVLVHTGYGEEEIKSNQVECDYIADDLYGAAEYILSLSRKPGTASYKGQIAD